MPHVQWSPNTPSPVTCYYHKVIYHVNYLTITGAVTTMVTYLTITRSVTTLVNCLTITGSVTTLVKSLTIIIGSVTTLVGSLYHQVSYNTG